MIGRIFYTSTGQILKVVRDVDVGRYIFSAKIPYSELKFDGDSNEELLAQLIENSVGYWVDVSGPTLKKGAVTVELTENEYSQDLKDHWVQGMEDLNQIIGFNLDLDFGLPVANLSEANAALTKIQTALSALQVGIKNLATIDKKEARMIRYIYDRDVPEEE